MTRKQLELKAQLDSGLTVSGYKEGGNSMTPIIKSQQPVTVAPLSGRELAKGDVVFCKVNGRFMLHKILAIKDGQVQIGNNHGRINGWTSVRNVFGIVTKVHPQ